MDKDHFSTQNKIFNALDTLSVELGANPDTINPMNALRSVTKAVKELMTLETTAQKLGYTSAAVALKALSQYKDKVTQVDINTLPEVFHKVPMVWLKGRPNGKRLRNGFAPMTPSQAKLKHALLLPLLTRVWLEIGDDERVQNELIDAYLTTSALSFETDLFAYDGKIEDYNFYEVKDYDQDPSLAELSIAATQTRGEHDYGVGGVLDEVVWDD